MADLISRAYVLAEYDRQHKGPPGGARKIMEEAPAVDAVPVVRCKDCRHWHEDIDANTKWLMCHEIVTDRNWFCANGERRDGNGADA